MKSQHGMTTKYCLLLSAMLVAGVGGCTDDSKQNTLKCETGLTVCGASCCEYTCVDDVCIDTSSNHDKCGANMVQCGAGESCIGGECKSESSCSGTQEWCDGVGCKDIKKDKNNCGACGHVCESYESCVSGSCTVECANGMTACGANCVNTTTDADNCGECGTVCGNNSFCSNSSCACRSGYYDCDNDASNGCESTSACGNGENTEITCDPGTKECNGSCVVYDTDHFNCGDCGVVCDTNQVCVGGNCEEPEEPVDCSSDDENAPVLTQCWDLCFDLNNDINHCGDCDVACGSGEECIEGNCKKKEAILADKTK